MKKFILALGIVVGLFSSAHAAFKELELGTLSCSSPNLTGLLTFFPGAPENDYKVEFSPSGDLADLVKIADGDFGGSTKVNFNIPDDESSGLSFDLELDLDAISQMSGCSGGRVTITASPGNNLTETTGFGTVTGSLTISDEGCTTSPPEEEEVACSADFSTNGLQPVGASFQDDKHFKTHIAVVGPTIADLGGTITYAVSENDPKDLVNNRSTIVLARNPDYQDLADLTEITFTGTSNYTRNVPVQLKITASDAASEVMSYKHSVKASGPFGEPCGTEEQQFSITFKIDKVLKRKPKPPTFKFVATGAGEVKAEVARVSAPDTAIMSTTTSFTIAKTSMGKIGILPVGNPTSPNVKGISRKLTKDASLFSSVLARTIPDFMPLPSDKVSVTKMPLMVFRPVDTSSINGAAAKEAQIAANFTKLQRAINRTADSYKKRGDVDILITVIDSDTFADLDSSSPAAFAFVGSADSPGDAFVQTSSVKSKFKFSTLLQRVEDAVHEIAHSYGFVGNGTTICPPKIHNVSSNFSDSCRITRRLRVSNVCKLDQPHIMGPSFPSTMITQCTYEDLVDRFKTVAASKARFAKNLTAQNGTASLQLEMTVATDGASASFHPVYDSERDPSEFLGAATDTSWQLNLKNSSGTSISRLHFEFDPSEALPESSLSSVVLEKRIDLVDGLASVELINANSVVLASKSIEDEIPAVEILSADLANSSKGASLDLEWSIVDNSDGETLTTVLIGADEESLVVYGDGFELEANSVSLSQIPGKPKFVQVVVTNGSRSAKSEIMPL